jgi:hypothetical protein
MKTLPVADAGSYSAPFFVCCVQLSGGEKSNLQNHQSPLQEIIKLHCDML